VRRGELRERDHSEKLGVDGTITLKWFFTRWDVEAWNGLLLLMIGTGGGLL